MLYTEHPYLIVNEKSGAALDLSFADSTSVIGHHLYGGVNQIVRPTAATPSISCLYL